MQATEQVVDTETISGWVRRWAPLIPGGEVLDLACGAGRHARHLVSLGHPVIALDHDPEMLEKAAGTGITTSLVDLEGPDAAWPFAPCRFAGIVVTNYLHRPLLEAMIASLAPDGVLVYETFAEGNEQFGKPSNPAFLLKEGEMLAWAVEHGLRVVAYEDGRVEQPKAALVQRICAVRPDFPRLAALLPTF
ncbi:class I SAM-dependent methyltransferase [Janthinobacterium sp. BJB1]|uniref:class I SAM-dependent methyltransferase n=1 Tax=Janthinobacterium sp. GW458P TaxID=1981504 RepID=UPI000A32A217|nr:class I SAM-dependent methyltransferase [Janthinobacterium sp. GW458P]MBE3023242.1 class I SAM-dependent methyltransferase [Janthinobacterium sp. GW458P]PHV16181.1 class I SAM-dependent methyltransferase [Janthinobacterium sp. BJB303]PJC98503.1 class I SAM-dependent methyltransferase [Janthinobacterium sp. BJB1]